MCVCTYCVYSRIGSMDGGVLAAHLDDCQRCLLPSNPLWKVVLPMHKHNAASAEQERTQPRDTGGPHGPQRQWEAALLPRMLRVVCRGCLAHKLSSLKKKRKRIQSWLNLNPLVVFSFLIVVIIPKNSQIRAFVLVPELGAVGAPSDALPIILGKCSFSSYRHLAKGKSLPQSAYCSNAAQMYLYFYNVFWPRTVGKVSSQRRRRA